ncbi:MAG TPA: lysylphosphatidylglycerol synthase transmembrane domain-containing protein, partial [Phototrophicaceae bacterium]|nr:lysylphosphatidylglycerol synthase transmembrane domain-containing protein [Phototrophicaceae bacterium]
MTESPAPSIPRKLRFSWSAVLTLLLALVLLFLALRNVDWSEMLLTVQQSHIEYLALAFVLLTCSYFLRSLRWRTLLNGAPPAHPLHPLTTFWGTCIGYLGNYFLPARAGELIRSALMAQRGGINFMYVVATALTERIMDAALLVLIVIGLLPTLPSVPDWLLAARQGMLIIGIGGLIGLLLAPRLEGLALAILMRLPLPDTLKERLKTLMEKFLLGVRAFQHPVRGGTFLVLTAMIWSLDVIIALQVA